MARFDHARAWRELAAPAFCEECRHPMRMLYYQIRSALETPSGPDGWMGRMDQHEVTLDVEAPPALHATFDQVDAAFLAEASRIVHAYGHWYPSSGVDRGAYWRFSNLADQSLRRRLGGLPRSRGGNGIFYEVREGFLHVCLSTPDMWTAEAVGLATPAVHRTAISICPSVEKEKVTRREGQRLERAYLGSLEALRRECAPSPQMRRFMTARVDNR